MYSNYGRLCYVVIGLIISISFLSSFSFAIKLYPTNTNIGENYFNKQTLVLTILNDDPGTKEISLFLSPESQYLSKYIKFETTNLFLKTNTKYNLQIDIYFEKNMSPEKHVFEIIALTDDWQEAKSVYEFRVPGVAKPNLAIDYVDVEDIVYGESVYMHINLQNYGNVIARAKPKILLFNDTHKVGELDYKENIMVMPEEGYNLSLMYDTSSFPVGEYQLEVMMTYNDNLTTNIITNSFDILKPEKDKSSTNSANFWWFKGKYLIFVVTGFIFLIVVGLILSKSKSEKKARFKLRDLFFKGNDYKIYKSKMDSLDMKCDEIEKNMKEMFNSTHKFIESSNEWFDKNFPNENYKFK